MKAFGRATCALAGAAAVLGVAIRLVAEQASPQAVFRAGVDHVALDVVVTDNHDRPLAGLTKDQFTISEAGRSQEIADFDFVSIPPLRRTLDASKLSDAPSIDVASNVAPSHTSRAFVMVIDDLHIVEADILPVRRIITEFVQSLSSDDEAAVVFMSRSDLSVDLTRDERRLLATADHVRDALGFGEDALGATTPGGAVIGPLVNENARRSDFVLKNVAQSLAGSGFVRRAIVYVSDGATVFQDPCIICPFGHGTDVEWLKDAYDAAHRADVPIYPIDPRGLVQPEQAVRGGIGTLGGYGKQDASVLRRLIASNLRNQQNRLRSQAEQTGGRAFVNRNDLPAAVDELMADNSSFYVLGYYPNPFSADGKYHEVQVKVKRPGTRVRARSGYVASAAADTTTAAKPGAAVDEAIGGGVSIADISLRAIATPLVAGPRGVSTAVTVLVTYPSLPSDAASVNDDVDFRLLALDLDGKVKASTGRGLHVQGMNPAGVPMSFTIDEAIDLPPQRLLLRVGVSSRLLNKTGTVQMSLDVPKPSAQSLQITGVAIGVESVASDAERRGALPADLLPFAPTTSRTFSATDTLRVYAPISWGNRGASATADVSVTGSDTVAPQHLTVAASPDSSGLAHGIVDTRVPLAGLAPGHYGLQLAVALADGRRVERTIAIEVKQALQNPLGRTRLPTRP